MIKAEPCEPVLQNEAFMSMQPILRFLVITGLCAAAGFSGLATAQRSIPVDRVVAVVNNDAITALQLREAVERVTGQLRRQRVEVPPLATLEKQVLERMILERAQLQLARENGLRVDEATMKRALARIGDNAGLSEAELREALRRDGISWDKFREGIRNEILITRLRESEVDSRIVITDAEIDNFIATRAEAPPPEREVLVAHILIRVPEDAGAEDLAGFEQKAAEVISRHAAGETFEQLAAEFSDAPDATQGGVIGWRTPERLPALFAKAVEGLSPGQLSEQIRSPAGLHVVKLVDARGGADGGERVDQTRARHILMRTTEVLPDSEVQARLAALRERIVVGGESFEDLAKVHSDDLSGARGGDLGWVHRGDTVPEFERVMDSLKVGEISQPVRSPFGWHLIQVVERRTQDMSEDRRRAQARIALRERKSDEAYENWLRELRDSTYVDIRLDRE